MNGLWGETIGTTPDPEKGFTFAKEFSVAMKPESRYPIRKL
jgi:hypothetical protein